MLNDHQYCCNVFGLGAAIAADELFSIIENHVKSCLAQWKQRPAGKALFLSSNGVFSVKYG
jgi:hypothetical protein